MKKLKTQRKLLNKKPTNYRKLKLTKLENWSLNYVKTIVSPIKKNYSPHVIQSSSSITLSAFPNLQPFQKYTRRRLHMADLLRLSTMLGDMDYFSITVLIGKNPLFKKNPHQQQQQQTHATTIGVGISR